MAALPWWALSPSPFFAGPVEACVERLQAQAKASVDLHRVNVDMGDPHRAARNIAKLVG
jgi:hypothetical protein